MKLFWKNEIWFAVSLIAFYVLGVSAMQRISGQLGMQFFAEMIFCLVMTAVLLAAIRKHGLTGYLGLKRPAVKGASMLWYLPLLLIACTCVFFGIGAEFGLRTSIFRSVMMLCVGILEEILFRGFLFRAIEKENRTRAVVISALAFGAGHIVNLANGAGTAETVSQVIFACAVGFVLVFIFLRTESILPCIAFHALNNILTAFGTGSLLIDRFGETGAALLASGLRLILSAAYLWYVCRRPPRTLPGLPAAAKSA